MKYDYYYDNEKNELIYYDDKKKKNNNKFKKFIAGLTVVTLVGAGSLGTGYGIGMKVGETKTKQTATLNEQKSNIVLTSALEIEANNIKVINDLSNAVVSINTASSAGNYYRTQEVEGAGSGVIISEDDENIYIVTNNHVIDGANTVKISLDDTKEVSAHYVGTDINQDIAVISVKKSDLAAAGIDNYTIATFADSDALLVGQEVIAIGNSAGEGKSATKGIISAINKEIDVDNTTLKVVQTDAAINPGNSGGALVDMNSQIVGINTAKYSGSSLLNGNVEGMGYSIPSNIVKDLVQRIINGDSTITEGETVDPTKPILGIYGGNITEEIINSNFLPYKIPYGIYINSITRNGSAEKAGIIEGDIITSFNGKSVTDIAEIVTALDGLSIGDEVEVVVNRAGETLTLTAVLQDANSTLKF